MNALAMVLCLALAPEDPALATRVESQLEQDPDLIQQHRGYMSYLSKRPRLAETERAYWRAIDGTSLRFPADDFDRALARDRDGRRRYRSYARYLAENPAPRQGVEQLARVEQQDPALRTRFGDALAYLRSNPGIALRFLGSPETFNPLPGALTGFDRYVGVRPELGTEMAGALQQILSGAESRDRVSSWWNAVAEERGEAPAAFRTLYDDVSVRSGTFWTWHERELALAEEPEADEWVRYWHGAARREPEIATRYGQYLDLLGRAPGYAEQLEDRWSEQYGEAPEWPPERRPPRLTPMERPGDDEQGLQLLTPPQRPTRPPRPSMPRPPRPSLPRPARPRMPARPTPKPLR